MTPFEILGLPATDLTDDEVRAAWRRIAEATHPDLADGGDPVAYAAAAAAYTLLRTSSGRGEALADLRDPGTAARLRATRISRRGWLRLAARLAVAAAVVALAVAVAGWQPASVAILAGMMTWLLLTGRGDG